MFLLDNVPHLTKGCSLGQLSVTECLECNMEIMEGRGVGLVMKGCLTDFLDIQ